MSSSTGQTRKLWVESEDEKLREGVKEQMVNNGAVKDWNRIALTLAGRSNKDCRKRWSKISKDVKKGLWDTQEDTRLREGIKQYGMRWTQVAEYVGTRHADQCAKRWTHSLDPELSQNNGADQEDKALIASVSKKGRQWKDIEENDLPGRPKSAINNRHAVVKRRKQSAEPRHSLSSLSQKRTAAALSVSQQDLLEREEELSDSFSESADEDKSDVHNDSSHHRHRHHQHRHQQICEGTITTTAGNNNNIDLQCHRAAASWLSTGDGAFLSSDPLNWDSLECSSQDVHMLGLEDATASGYISAPGSSSLPSHFLPDEGSLQSQPPSAICMTDMFGHFCNSFPLPMTSSGMMSVNVVDPSPSAAAAATALQHHHHQQTLSPPAGIVAAPPPSCRYDGSSTPTTSGYFPPFFLNNQSSSSSSSSSSTSTSSASSSSLSSTSSSTSSSSLLSSLSSSSSSMSLLSPPTAAEANLTSKVKVNIIPRTAKVKTVLELDDIPQKALYQIMSIALENKSRIRVETSEMFQGSGGGGGGDCGSDGGGGGGGDAALCSSSSSSSAAAAAIAAAIEPPAAMLDGSMA